MKRAPMVSKGVGIVSLVVAILCTSALIAMEHGRWVVQLFFGSMVLVQCALLVTGLRIKK